MKSFKNEIIEEMSNNSMSSEWKKKVKILKECFLCILVQYVHQALRTTMNNTHAENICMNIKGAVAQAVILDYIRHSMNIIF